MKKLRKYSVLAMALALLFFSCSQEEFELQSDIAQVGSLEGPVNDTNIQIDPENGESVTFSWTPAQAADGGLVLYTVLFDVEGGSFEEPIYSIPSDNKGGGTTLTLSQVFLNIIAAKADIEQLTTGKVKWTVKASSGYQSKVFDQSLGLSLTRPEGLAIFPKYMYIHGSATEGQELSSAVAFKEIVNELPTDNFNPGVFESITKLSPGEFYIVDSNNPDSTINRYYLNNEGKIRSGDQATNFTGEEGVYRVRMNLSAATISYEKISDLQLYIFASQVTKAELTYVGNHTFESTSGYFEFLNPGDPEAPDWLGWEEERYRFRFMVDGNQSYIGSFHNEAMNASLVDGQSAYNVRPNGEEPASYYNTYFLGADAGYWQGAWKFADDYNGADFTVRVVFDPKADHYYHEFELN
ncbi:SusE domain-containing protein [Marinoscillum sp.]|uniref:SusE domain-containing protein n=1 Tax=Marinoscillum sp. TaxID=2024838 RepID=UPI003BAAE289